MAILLTGGSGKTSTRIAKLLQDAKIPFLLASRGGAKAAPEGMPAVKFDWLDSSTWDAAFEHKFTKSLRHPTGEKIDTAYIMVPIVEDPETSMIKFVDYARKEHGVKRFVLIAGSSIEPNGPGPGKVWQHFLDTGVDYAVLRPTWFMQNLSEEAQRFVIKDGSAIYTACDDAKIPFVSTTDIAAVAFKVLTDKKSHNTDYRILGPELLTYDQVAEKLSKVLGRKITHVKLSGEDRLKGLLEYKVPDILANFLVYLEVGTAGGMEERENNVVEEVTGKKPMTFDEFAVENKAVWE